VGFRFDEEGLTTVASGNWGCGAFAGDHRLKLLIQWIACSIAGKHLVYNPFGSREIVWDNCLLERVGGLKVGELYRILLQACRKCVR